MKLPKPGKVKLPKPGKVKLPKPGNLKLPAFNLKNGFLKKNMITLIAAAVLLIGTGTAYGTLSTREADRGFDPIEGVNQDRYQVLVSGEGYKLTKIQERNYKLQKKQNEVNAAQAAQNAMNNPTTIRTSSGYRTYRPSNYTYRSRYNSNSNSSYTSSVYVATNFYSQKNTKMNWYAGDKFPFIVQAYTFKNGKKEYLSKDEVKVKIDKGSVKYNKSEGDNHYYDLTLGTGMNTITVTVKDKKNKKESKYTFTIMAGRSSSEETNPSSTKPSTTKPSTTKPSTTKPSTTSTTKPKTVDKAVDIGFGLTSERIRITDNSDAYYVLSHTDNITTSNRKVIEVTGNMKEISLKKIEGYNEDAFKEIYKREKESEIITKIADDKKANESEISEKLKEEKYPGKTVDEMSEDEINDLNEYIREHFDEYYMRHYYDKTFDKIFNEWLDVIEQEIRNKSSIRTGDIFHDDYQFKWEYNNVKGIKNVTNKKKINLRLILEKI